MRIFARWWQACRTNTPENERRQITPQNLKSIIYILTICGLTIFIACNQKEKVNSTNTKKEEVGNSTFIPNEKFLEKHSDTCHCSAQFELNDSLKLEHIKNQFYKSKTGHLYERTKSQIETGNPNEIKFKEYFNGYFSQEIDPYTFEELHGWYAKDKNNVYYYRPTSGGMQISIMKEAHTKTFKILKGHYKYASDKNYFFNETEIINGYIPNKTTFTFDNKSRIKEMICRNKKYKFEIVN